MDDFHAIRERLLVIASDKMAQDRQYTKKAAREAADALEAAQKRIARYEEALEELSCRHVTVGPLWWQQIARKALEGK